VIKKHVDIRTLAPHTHTPQPFYGPFSGTTQVSWCQKRTSGLYGTREINRGRHTDHQTTSAHLQHCPIFFMGWMPFLPPNQQCQSTEGHYRIRITEKMLELSTVLPAPSLYHYIRTLTAISKKHYYIHTYIFGTFSS